MVEFQKKDRYSFADLQEIVRILRAPGGCPWDAEQTHASLRRPLLEEAYEVIEAIDEQNPEHLKEELGDVLLQVVFHADIEREQHNFDIEDVCDGICKKLIYRHPHVFGTITVHNTEEVLQNWDALKAKEKDQKTVSDSMQSVAKSLPQLLRADKVQHKASKVGFDWACAKDALDKVREETDEVAQALDGAGNFVEEIGDLLFATVNVARLAGVNPEEALGQATDKFMARFQAMEALAKEQGNELSKLSLSQMDTLWNTIKQTKKE